jgi:hypothetical protein
MVVSSADPRVTALARPRRNCRVNYRQVLSSERVPHIKKLAIIRQKTKIWSWAPDGSPTPRQTGRLTVGRKLTSLHFTSTEQESTELGSYPVQHRPPLDLHTAHREVLGSIPNEVIGLLQPLTEMSSRRRKIFLGSKARQVRRADLKPICGPHGARLASFLL